MNSLPPATWKKNKRHHALLIAAWFAFGSGHASAQDEGVAPFLISGANLSGSVRGSVWGVSNNASGNNDPSIAELWWKATPRIGHVAALVVEGWVRTPDVFHMGKTEGMLREGYLSFGDGDADFRIGKQIIVWGRADQLNPTDNLSPRDYTLFTVENDDQRQGALALRTTYTFYSIAVTGIWLPRFHPNKQPIAAGSEVMISESVPGGDQFAFKLEQSGLAVEWSLSYFRGFDLNPDISISATPPGALALSLRHHRVRVLGADAATVLGRYGLRAEAAYTWTEDAAGAAPFVKNSFFYGVAGADRTFFEYLNVNMQYFVRKVAAYSDPRAIADPMIRTVALQQAVVSNQLECFQQGASLRISDKWLHETLEAEVAVVFNFTRHDYLLRPKLSYAVDDHWKGSLGANVFRGGNDTFFGLMRDRSAVFAEMRYGF